MFTLIVIAVLLALGAAGYSFYVHRKLTGVQQVIDDLKALAKGKP